MSKRKKSSKKHDFQARVQTSVSQALTLRILAGVAIIVVVISLAYLPSLSGGFVWDDKILLSENEIIQTSDGLYRLWCTTEPPDYWPMTYTTFWIEWRLWGMNQTGYHLTNLILHISESLLIWLILRKLSIPGAFLAAMIFALHPVNVESVAWIAQRKNIMSMLFFLLSILWYLRFVKPAPLRVAAKQFTDHCPPSTAHIFPWYWLSLAAFALAMLSKGSAAVLPALLLGILWWLRSLTRRDLLRIAPFFLLAVVLTGVNIWFQSHGAHLEMRNAGFLERLLGAGVVPWFYLYKALLPIDLAFIYPLWHIEVGDPLWWLPLLAALIVTAVLWRYRKGWSRPLLFAWGFFCVSLVPVMGLTDVGFMKYSLVSDHYQHIAIIGIIALAAAGWSIWLKRARNRALWVKTAVTVAAIGTLAFLTWRQNDIYHDAIRLHKATLQKNPGFWLAHYNLGLALANAGLLQEAIEHYEATLRLKPDYVIAQNNLGLALVKAGRLQEAIEHYGQALRLEPDYANAHLNLGVALVKAGRLQEAIEHFEQALRLKPDNADAHLNLGLALAKAGRLQEAIEHYQQALRLKPDNAYAHINMGIALVQTDRHEEAIEHFKQALRLKPDIYNVHYNLGNEYVKTGQLQEAIEHYRQALLLNPDYIEAHNNLGLALTNAGRLKEAIEHFKQALRLKRDFTNAYYNLALAYAKMGQSSEAVAAAQKALELARSQGKTALAKQIEDWLNSYRAGLSDPDAPPVPKSVSPPP